MSVDIMISLIKGLTSIVSTIKDSSDRDEALSIIRKLVDRDKELTKIILKKDLNK